MAAGGAAAGALAGILIGRNLVRLREGLAQAPEAWKPLADKGLALVTDEDRPSLVGEIRGVSVRVHVVTDIVRYAHTRIVAAAGERAAASVGVYPSPAGLLGKLRSLISQDVEIGDEVFDQEFLIHSEPRSAAASLLSPETRELLTGLAGTRLAAFRYDADGILVQLHGVELDPAVIEAAVDVVVTAARWSP